MHSIISIEHLGFEHLGSRWFKHIDKPFKLRQWKDYQIDLYKVYSDGEEQLVFRGYLPEITEIEWVLGRVSI